MAWLNHAWFFFACGLYSISKHIDISGKNIFFSWHKIGILYEHLIRNYSEVAVRNTKTISAKKDKIE